MTNGKKRNLILAGLIVVLGVAVYLNWQFAPEEDFIESGSSTSSGMLGEAMLVAAQGDVSSSDAASAQVSADVQQDAVSAAASDYFATARSEREKAREESLETLKDIISSASQNDVDKSEAVGRSAMISQQIKDENAIETLVKAKGFSDCVAVISTSQVSVIVPNTKQLTQSEVSIITDIVMGQTNVAASCINIVQPKLNVSEVE